MGEVLNGITFTYDNGLGLLTKSQQDHEELANGNSADVQYTYDMTPTNYVITGAARLTQVTYPGPSGSRRGVYYNLAASGLWAGIDRLDNIAKAGGTPKYAEFTYMGAGAIVKEAHTEVTNGLTLDYDIDDDKAYKGFDNVGRIIDQRWQNDTPTVKDQFKYTYDRASNRTSRDVGPDMASPPSGFDEHYLYDGLHRLMKMNRGDLDSGSIADGDAAYSQAWAFWNTEPEPARWDTELDAVGNWTKFKIDNGGGGPEDVGWELKQTRTNNEVNEITGISKTVGDDWYDPAYNANGNMLSGPMPGDEDDADGTEHHYLYDAWNRLKVVYIDDGDDEDEWDAGDTLVAKFEYDGLHRRIVKIVPNAGTPANRDRTDYYYNTSWQVLEERLADDVDVDDEDDEATLAKYQYVWSLRYIDAPVLRIRDEGTNGENIETLYYTNDANMNVTALINTSGAVVERYKYDPYGAVTVLDADGTEDEGNVSDVDNEILYCGYRHDPETGLYHVRRRYHHPTLGRWLTRDPIGYADGINLYEDRMSNPGMYADAFGEKVLYQKLVTKKPKEQYGHVFKGKGTIHMCFFFTYRLGDCCRVEVKKDPDFLKKKIKEHKLALENWFKKGKYQYDDGKVVWDVEATVVITESSPFPRLTRKSTDTAKAKDAAQRHVFGPAGIHTNITILCKPRDEYNARTIPGIDPKWPKDTHVEILVHELLGHGMNAEDEYKGAKSGGHRAFVKTHARAPQADSVMVGGKKGKQRFYPRHFRAAFEDIGNATGERTLLDDTIELSLDDPFVTEDGLLPAFGKWARTEMKFRLQYLREYFKKCCESQATSSPTPQNGGK